MDYQRIATLEHVAHLAYCAYLEASNEAHDNPFDYRLEQQAASLRAAVNDIHKQIAELTSG
jgi:hypothetical protein